MWRGAIFRLFDFSRKSRGWEVFPCDGDAGPRYNGTCSCVQCRDNEGQSSLPSWAGKLVHSPCRPPRSSLRDGRKNAGETLHARRGSTTLHSHDDRNPRVVLGQAFANVKVARSAKSPSTSRGGRKSGENRRSRPSQKPGISEGRDATNLPLRFPRGLGAGFANVKGAFAQNPTAGGRSADRGGRQRM